MWQVLPRIPAASNQRNGSRPPPPPPHTRGERGRRKDQKRILRAACDKKFKKSSEAAALFCKNPSARDGGKIKELGIGSAKNSGVLNVAAVSSNSVYLEPKKRLQLLAAATTSSSKRGIEEAEAYATTACAPGDRQSTAEGSSKQPGSRCQSSRNSKKDGRDMGAGVLNFISQAWMQRRCRPDGPDLSLNKTSFLNHLFECCGLVDLIIGKDLKLPHINEQRTPISEAEGHYKIIKKPVLKKLSKVYSSFRVVLGDGECFYRSFIYSYMELVLENNDISEESRLLCAIEEISSACMGLEWLYKDFDKPYTAFKELLQKVKSWKTDAKAVRRMLLLKYFGDYKETEAIFSFLRISSAAWILTHPDFSGFHAKEDGNTLEEYCRSQIVQSRSYADNLAITALADALGIQIRIFSLVTGQYQDVHQTL